MFKIDENYTDYYKTDPVKYPGGGAINSSGIDTTDGTPWLAKMFDNCVGWMQALYIKAFGSLTGISGEAENAQTSDVVRALDKIRGDNNAAERTISENTYFKKAGGVISGDTSVEGQLHVKGDLLVDGIGEEIISSELKVGANTITLRNGNPSALGNTELAGVVTENYDGNNHNNIIAVRQNGEVRTGDIDIATRFLYSNDGTNFYADEDLTIPATIGTDENVRDTGNQTSGGVKIYEGITYSNDDTQPLLTRAESNALANGHILVWDATNKRVVDSGRGITDAVTSGDTNLVSSGAVWTAIAAMFPVGTIYQNRLDSRSPATLLGFGTWVQITDKFLAAIGPSHIGADGGRWEFTIESGNLPHHQHLMTDHIHNMEHMHSYDASHKHDITDPGHLHALKNSDGSVAWQTTALTHVDGGNSIELSNGTAYTDIYASKNTTGMSVNETSIVRWTAGPSDYQGAGKANTGGMNGVPIYTGLGGGVQNPTAISIIPTYTGVYTWYRTA